MVESLPGTKSTEINHINIGTKCPLVLFQKFLIEKNEDEADSVCPFHDGKIHIVFFQTKHAEKLLYICGFGVAKLWLHGSRACTGNRQSMLGFLSDLYLFISLFLKR